MTVVPAPPVPERFATRRLILRRPVADDAAAIFRDYAQDAEVARFLVWPVHRRLAETDAFLADCAQWWREGSRFPYVITTRERPDQALGMIDIRLDGTRTHLGYVLGRRHWGRGFMTEALTALVDWSLAQPAIFRAQAFCDIDNLASARVMEKAGMQFEGVLRRWSIHPNISAQPRDCRLYAKVRA